MYVIIIGCGRVGYLISNRLSKEGHDVVVIDNDEASFDSLSSEFSGFSLLGDAGEIEILKQAGIEKADSVFVTTRKDNLNLMVAQVAKSIFDVPYVVAKLYDPKSEEIFSSFGIRTISPPGMAVQEFLQEIKKLRKQ